MESHELVELARNPDVRVRRELVSRPELPDEVVAVLVEDEDGDVLTSLLMLNRMMPSELAQRAGERVEEFRTTHPQLRDLTGHLHLAPARAMLPARLPSLWPESLRRALDELEVPPKARHAILSLHATATHATLFDALTRFCPERDFGRG
jgi:uncharacterized protein (DUF2336 family)